MNKDSERIFTPDNPRKAEPMNNFIIIDDAGLPIGTMDVNRIQDDGLNLAFRLAAHSGDEDKTEQILVEQLERHGTQGVGYVLIAAIKHLTNDILAGAFNVMEAATGTKPRTKMAELAAMEGTTK